MRHCAILKFFRLVAAAKSFSLVFIRHFQPLVPKGDNATYPYLCLLWKINATSAYIRQRIKLFYNVFVFLFCDAQGAIGSVLVIQCKFTVLIAPDYRRIR